VVVAEFCGDLNPLALRLKSKEGHAARVRSVCLEIARAIRRWRSTAGGLTGRARFRWKFFDVRIAFHQSSRRDTARRVV
jgi:hypothetical protein